MRFYRFGEQESHIPVKSCIVICDIEQVESECSVQWGEEWGSIISTQHIKHADTAPVSQHITTIINKCIVSSNSSDI